MKYLLLVILTLMTLSSFAFGHKHIDPRPQPPTYDTVIGFAVICGAQGDEVHMFMYPALAIFSSEHPSKPIEVDIILDMPDGNHDFQRLDIEHKWYQFLKKSEIY